ncbi:DUF4352 domain-containing protein [Arthrobacter sp. zg-Y859]|uniref:DUF4352 domain-containing protein n=1 Tax=Arthrobacter jinronghuae TaxID=2964609 RepID=A0ABT1NSN3_9MICC|nr:DUF4352 domain-containing protein [Arthrobacter jinronghuae]MCQ1950748.1 DUF4352 domain-containing protein [Arthrobacter jinronghuae]UWX79219.1 DUF4352 domain-containing protein [Arthrobacter jinronghuae]
MDNTSFKQYTPARQHDEGSVPQGPPTGGPEPPGTPVRNPEAGKGLAITALVIGLVSLLLCWVPIVNNLVFLLGLIGLGFAIPAVVVAVRNRSRSKGMSIAGLILVVLSLVGVVATQAFYGQVIDDVTESVAGSEHSTADDSAASAGSSQAGQTEALGETARVGDYNVTVTGVDTAATQEILAVNPLNDDPEGEYVLVDLTVEYVGNEEGDPWLDLQTKFVGSDAKQYDSATGAVVALPDYDVPTLEKGGTAHYQVCMDVPAEAASTADAKVLVEPTFSMHDNDGVYWAVR